MLTAEAEVSMTQNGRRLARIGGILYAVVFVAGLFGEVFVAGRLVVEGDGAATAARILGAESLWRAAVSAQMLTMLCDVGIAWILYAILEPADRNLALFAALLRLLYVPVYAVASYAQFIAFRAHDGIFAMSLLLFGTHLAVAGYLFAKPPFSIRWLSWALGISGVCYVVNTLTVFASPPVHDALFPWILLVPFAGELALCVWLLLGGPGRRRLAQARYRASASITRES
jgi:hypothetical protein